MTKVVNRKHNVPYDIYIGRGSIWGNPFTSKPLESTKAKHQASSKEEAIRMFKRMLVDRKDLVKEIPNLKGKVLACYCKPHACHGDVLSAIAENLNLIFAIGEKILVSSETNDKKGILQRDPKLSFTYSCDNFKCYQVHLRVFWEDGSLSMVCIDDVRKINENKIVIIERKKQTSLFNL